MRFSVAHVLVQAFLSYLSDLFMRSILLVGIFAFLFSVKLEASTIYLVDTDCKIIGASFGSDSLGVYQGDKHVRKCQLVDEQLKCGFVGTGKYANLKFQTSYGKVSSFQAEKDIFNLSIDKERSEYKYSAAQFDKSSNSLVSKSCAGKILDENEWSLLTSKKRSHMVADSQ